MIGSKLQPERRTAVAGGSSISMFLEVVER